MVGTAGHNAQNLLRHFECSNRTPTLPKSAENPHHIRNVEWHVEGTYVSCDLGFAARIWGLCQRNSILQSLTNEPLLSPNRTAWENRLDTGWTGLLGPWTWGMAFIDGTTTIICLARGPVLSRVVFKVIRVQRSESLNTLPLLLGAT